MILYLCTFLYPILRDRNNHRNVLRNIANCSHSRIDLEKIAFRIQAGQRLNLLCGKVRHLTVPCNSFEFEPLLPTVLPTHFRHLRLFLSSSREKDDWPRRRRCLHRAAVAPVNFFSPSSLTSAVQRQPRHRHHIGHSAAHRDALAPRSTQAPTSHLPLLPSYLPLALCVHASHPAAAVSRRWFRTHKFLFLFSFFPLISNCAGQLRLQHRRHLYLPSRARRRAGYPTRPPPPPRCFDTDAISTSPHPPPPTATTTLTPPPPPPATPHPPRRYLHNCFHPAAPSRILPVLIVALCSSFM